MAYKSNNPDPPKDDSHAPLHRLSRRHRVNRKDQGLSAKPIDDAALTSGDHRHPARRRSCASRTDALQYFIYNTLPGTTGAAGEKARFLKDIILGETCDGITVPPSHSNFCRT